MIIDIKKNSSDASYSVFSARTGECLDQQFRIFYADDEAGIIRCYLTDENGSVYLRDPATKQKLNTKEFLGWTKDGKKLYPLMDGTWTEREPEVAWEEIKRAIKIRPKPQEESR
jgi:hypothetical protein